MRFRWIDACALMCVAIAPCADKKFSPAAASSYSNKQTNDRVTVAAEAYDTDELAHTAFGKMSPYQYGVLPILVIIQNDTDKAIRLDSLQVEYTTLEGSRVEPTPMEDVKYVGSAPKRPRPNSGSPIPPGVFKKKNPLNGQEIPERAFLARMLPPHESASGFFYFQAKHRPGSKLYLTGLTEAQTGKGFVYFEVGLDKAVK